MKRSRYPHTCYSEFCGECTCSLDCKFLPNLIEHIKAEVENNIRTYYQGYYIEKSLKKPCYFVRDEENSDLIPYKTFEQCIECIDDIVGSKKVSA